MGSYYLYADKTTRTLNELRVSVIPLAYTPILGTLTLTYDSLAYTNWFLEGNELHLIHTNPLEWDAFYNANYADPVQGPWIEAGYMGDASNAIAISYDHAVWNDTTKEFDTPTFAEPTLTLAEYERYSYYKIFRGIPSTWGTAETYWYAPRYAPVVLTDDDVQYYDQRDKQSEFSVNPLTGELTFYPRENLITNPAFLINNSGTGEALGWTISAGTLVPAASTSPYPVYGDKLVTVPAGESIYQTVRLRENKNHNISFYATHPTTTSVDLVVDVLDISSVSVAGPFTKTFTVGTDWSRLEAYIGEDDSYYGGNSLGALPETAYYLEIKIDAAAEVIVDAVQVHEGADSAPFLGVAAKATVEYEVDPSGVYQPDPSATSVIVDNVDTNPLTSLKPNGYMVWEEDGDSTTADWQLGKGGDAIRNDGSPVNEQGRYHFPYAKTSGIAKLIERQEFHREGWELDDEIIRDPVVIAVDSVEEVYPDNAYLVGPTTAVEVHFLAKAGESTVLLVLFYDQFNNPLVGVDASVEVVGPNASGPTTVTTDIAGRARYVYNHAVAGDDTITFSIGSVSQVYYSHVQA